MVRLTGLGGSGSSSESSDLGENLDLVRSRPRPPVRPEWRTAGGASAMMRSDSCSGPRAVVKSGSSA